MIKKIFLISLSVLGLTTSWSQQVVFSCPEGGGKNYTITAAVCQNSGDDSICLMLKDNDKIEYFLFSPDMKLATKFSPPNGLKNSVYSFENKNLLAMLVNQNGYNFIYSVYDKNFFDNQLQFRAQSVDFEKKQSEMKNYFIRPDGQPWLKHLAINHKFYGFFDDKEDQLIIQIMHEDGSTERKNISVHLKDFYNQKNITIDDYFRFCQAFSPSQETNLREGSDLTKFFIYPDKIIIIVQVDKEPPHLLWLDLKTFALTKRKLSMEGFCGFTDKKQTFYNNSYIFDSNLYVLNVCKDMIEIGIFNPETGVLLKKHQMSESDEFFSENDATNTTSVGSREKEKGLKTKELIKKLMKGSLGITVGKNDQGQIVLNCGTYDEKQVGGGGYYIGGFSFNSGSPTFDPNKNYKTSSKTAKVTMVTSFKVVLDPRTLNIVPSTNVQRRYDEVADYIQTLKPSAQARIFFVLRGKFYFGYYDDSDKQYTIEYVGEDKWK